MRLEISKKAISQLEDIYIYSYKNHGHKIADKYLDDIGSRIQELAFNPEVGTDFSFVKKGYRRLVILSHSVYYKVSADSIQIISILHQSQDVGRNL